MINYHKNDLINKTMDKYYETFSHMLDTQDFVPEKFNIKIGKYIFKNMKRTFRKIDKEDRIFQREFNKKCKMKAKMLKNNEKMAKNAQKTENSLKNREKVSSVNADSNDNS